MMRGIPKAKSFEAMTKKAKLEETFLHFCRNFRSGALLLDFCPTIQQGVLNADFYFPHDNVICELKNIEQNTFEFDGLEKRVMGTYKSLGYSLEDYVEWLFGRKYFPEDVSEALFSKTFRSMRQSVSKAYKQIQSSRALLQNPEAKGLILIANIAAHEFAPIHVMAEIVKEINRIGTLENTAVVFFSHGVYYDFGNNNPKEIWCPIDNTGGESLQQFIDELGTAWFDFCDKQDSRPRSHITDSDFSAIASAKPIKEPSSS